MIAVCQIIEVASIADAEGYTCARPAQAECAECGSLLCDRHSQSCSVCARIFCSPCLTDHIEEQFRPAGAVKQKRMKTA